jgi:DDE superfamily endonuclease
MGDLGNRCKISIDGTDCPIEEPQPFNKKYYSHKFNGAGVKYELGLCIVTGWIVWYNGPFPCGNTDLQIARLRVCTHLEKEERILADGGYRDDGQYFDTPTGLHNKGQCMRSLCRARHETVNG